MNFRTALLLSVVSAGTTILSGCASRQAFEPPAEEASIAFGSCLRQWQEQPVWQSINNLHPKAVLFLGDNVYADVGKYALLTEPENIGVAYDDLAATDAYRSFIDTAAAQGTELFATWDDHDYGRNDGGGDYPHKLASKQYFMDFYHLTETASGDASHAGVYQSKRLQVSGLDVQVLLLDTRSFRSPLKKNPADTRCPSTHTVAELDPGATMLGSEQWQWLEQELGKPADLRIIASSIQVIPQQHCFEKWANFPRERQRLFDLIRSSKANGVVLLSGDRHLAEISSLPAAEVGYPLYEITSSGLNSAMKLAGKVITENNEFRSVDVVFDDNFGVIGIRRDDRGITLALRIYRADGSLAREVGVPLEGLSSSR